jgi:hypothetical protein
MSGSVHPLNFVSAVANAEGNKVVITWERTQIASPPLWNYFKDNVDSNQRTNPSLSLAGEVTPYDELVTACTIQASTIVGSSGIGQPGSPNPVSGALATARGSESAGILRVVSTIGLEGKRVFQRGEPALITILADLFISDTLASTGAPNYGNLLAEMKPIDTSKVAYFPATGASGACENWCEARFDAVNWNASHTPPDPQYVDGSTIALPRDQSGRSHTLTAPAGNEPVLDVEQVAVADPEGDGKVYWYDFAGGNRLYKGDSGAPGDWFHTNNFEMWFYLKFASSSGTQTIFGKEGEMVLQTSGTQLQLKLSEDGSTWAQTWNICTITPGTAQLIGVVKDGTNIRACVDGFWSVITASGATNAVRNTTHPFTIGNRTTTPSTDAFTGKFSGWVIYNTKRTEPERAVIAHYAARRVNVKMNAGTLPTAQPYTAAQMPRRPVAVINLFGGNYEPAPPRDNLSGQSILTPLWFDWAGLPNYPTAPTQTQIRDSLLRQVDEIVQYSPDFDIQFRLPSGRLQDDIMSAAQFAYITQKQLDALQEVFDLRRLGNGEDGTRRAWFYRGTWMCIKESDFTYDYPLVGTKSGGQMNNRVVAHTLASEWKDRSQQWLDNSDDGHKFSCFFCDAGSQVPRKFLELAHDSAIKSAGYRLVGEAISFEYLLVAPWFAMVDIPSGAPWWLLNASGVPTRVSGYNADWFVDPNRTRVYFGVANTAGYVNTTPGGVTEPGARNMTHRQLVEFISKGGLPVAFPGTWRKVAEAWHYANSLGSLSADPIQYMLRKKRRDRISMDLVFTEG